MSAGRVQIRGAWWRIVLKRLGPSKGAEGWAATRGLCDFSTRTIFLNPQFDLLPTLLHEVTHACQPDLDEDSVEQIEEAHVEAGRVLERLLKRGG
jgi:hypothetical protein